MKLVALTALAALSACAVHSGRPVDSTKAIELSGRRLSPQALQAGQPVSPSSLQEALLADPASSTAARSVYRWGKAASLLGAAGYALMLWPLGESLAGNHAEWGFAAAGTGLVAIAIPTALVAERKLRKAVGSWNASRATVGPSACLVRDETGAVVAMAGFRLTY